MARRKSREKRKAAFLAAAATMGDELEAWYDAHPEASFGELEQAARQKVKGRQGLSAPSFAQAAAYGEATGGSISKASVARITEGFGEARGTGDARGGAGDGGEPDRGVAARPAGGA